MVTGCGGMTVGAGTNGTVTVTAGAVVVLLKTTGMIGVKGGIDIEVVDLVAVVVGDGAGALLVVKGGVVTVDCNFDTVVVTVFVEAPDGVDEGTTSVTEVVVAPDVAGVDNVDEIIKVVDDDGTEITIAVVDDEDADVVELMNLVKLEVLSTVVVVETSTDVVDTLGDALVNRVDMVGAVVEALVRLVGTLVVGTSVELETGSEVDSKADVVVLNTAVDVVTVVKGELVDKTRLEVDEV
jgi:hypothetical protein